MIIKAELVNVEDGSQIWGGQYNRESSDILALQEEISGEIAEKLRLKLTSEEKVRLTKRHTESAAAYQLYLQGRYFWNKRSEQSLKKGIEYFQKAIDTDPNYALAYALLSDSYIYLHALGGIPRSEVTSKAVTSARRALEIDNKLAEAHISLATVRDWCEWDFEGAEREYRRAIELNSQNATAHQRYGVYLVHMGRLEDALTELQRAQELDPLSLIINTDLGATYYVIRQYDQAIEQFQKTLEIDFNFALAHTFLGEVYSAKGMYEEAITHYLKARTLNGDHPEAILALREAYIVSGIKGYWQKVLDMAKEQLAQRKNIPPVRMAVLHIRVGEREEAFAWLEKAYEVRDLGLLNLIDPMFDSIRVDARFTDLSRRIGLF